MVVKSFEWVKNNLININGNYHNNNSNLKGFFDSDRLQCCGKIYTIETVSKSIFTKKFECYNFKEIAEGFASSYVWYDWMLEPAGNKYKKLKEKL